MPKLPTMTGMAFCSIANSTLRWSSSPETSIARIRSRVRSYWRVF